MFSLTQWITERKTPLLWLSGPAGAGKTAAVENILATTGTPSILLRLSAFDPDTAFAEAVPDASPLTASRLLALAGGPRLLVLDSFDAIQQNTGDREGDITDCRFRQLVRSVALGALPGAALMVTSRRVAPPFASDRSTAHIMMEPPKSPAAVPTSVISPDSPERRVLEIAALSRRSINVVSAAQMSGVSDRDCQSALDTLAKLELSVRICDDTFQVPESTRTALFEDKERMDSVRQDAIARLQEHSSHLERLFDLLIDDGRIGMAIMLYWNGFGNFARLHRDGRDHFGASLCRRLNDGLPPSDVSSRFRDADGVWAVLNDWSQFASCCGDAEASAQAATSAYGLVPAGNPPWSRAIIAAHAGEALFAAGDLPGAMEWSDRSWSDARQGMAKTEGFAVQEVMDAYDWSANTMGRVYSRLSRQGELQRLIDDLTTIHEHARESAAELSAGLKIPRQGPAGPVSAAELVGGRLTAMLALVEGRSSDLERLAPPNASTVAGREMQMVKLRAQLASGRQEQARPEFQLLRDSAQARDDSADECELAVLEEFFTSNPEDQLARTASYLPRAEACGLGLHWRDLQLSRARVLRDLGHGEEARHSAEAALLGSDTMAGACRHADWSAGHAAVELLDSLGVAVAEDVRGLVHEAVAPDRRSPRKGDKRRAPLSERHGRDAREDMHDAALRVLEAYEKEGVPFAVYFRKFSISVLHGPFETGPKLTENALRDALPDSIEVVTIQEHGTQSPYDLDVSRFRREAPALFLEDDEWTDVAGALIRAADLIVSEPLTLSPGVRFELQAICEASRWDRTVLVLPPLNSPFSTIDNDSVIQMFPRCVWADSLHQAPLTDSPVIADLLARLRTVAALPVETRRTLADPSARIKAHPIQLLSVAEYLENEAQFGSLFGGEDEVTRYYAFWQMFRAASIRGLRFKDGDTSATNRCRLARSYLQMSTIMLDHSREQDTVILQGDPADAQRFVQSAHALLDGLEEDLLVRALRGESEDTSQQLMRLDAAMKENPDRFQIRRRYGPFVGSKLSQRKS